MINTSNIYDPSLEKCSIKKIEVNKNKISCL